MEVKNKKAIDRELKLDTCDAELGKTYPIYGTLTNVWEGLPGILIAEIEHSILALIVDTDKEFTNALKEHLFEPGVFISTVLVLEDGQAIVRCTKAFFSKNSNMAH